MFDARHPGLSTAPPASPAPAGLAPIKIAPELFGKVGEYFAVSLSTLQRSLAALSLQPRDLHSKLDAVSTEIARLEQFGVQVQQLARFFGGHTPPARERVDLAACAQHAAAEWSRMAQPGVAVAKRAAPAAPLEIDPAILTQLLDFGMEYVLREGTSVDVSVVPEGQPPRPTLRIATRRSHAGPGGEADEVHWLLFTQLARAMGLSPQRLSTPDALAVTLAFPPAGDDADEVAATSPALPHTASAAGRHVLLIEPNDFSRMHAYRLLSEIGVRVDAASSLEQARSSLRGDPPDAVVTGVGVDDERCATLLEALRVGQPRLRVIELVDDADAFALSVPGADHPARVGREEMARTLTRALAQELDAAWPEA